jgi:hypothetical protein
MLNPEYIQSFENLLNHIIDLETNEANLFLLRQIRNIHFVTAFNHSELYIPIQQCIDNTTDIQLLVNYKALRAGIVMEVNIVASLS